MTPGRTERGARWRTRGVKRRARGPGQESSFFARPAAPCESSLPRHPAASERRWPCGRTRATASAAARAQTHRSGDARAQEARAQDEHARARSEVAWPALRAPCCGLAGAGGARAGEVRARASARRGSCCERRRTPRGCQHTNCGPALIKRRASSTRLAAARYIINSRVFTHLHSRRFAHADPEVQYSLGPRPSRPSRSSASAAL